MVALADSLVIYRGDRHEVTFTPHVFHVIKSVAHAPLAVYTMLERSVDAELSGFARKCGPDLLLSTERAARVQLSALDACVEDEHSTFSEQELGALQVVVTGNHQARKTEPADAVLLRSARRARRRG